MPPASGTLQPATAASNHEAELATISDSLVVLAKTTRQLGEFTGRLADRMGRIETKLDALVERLTRSAATQTVALLASSSSRKRPHTDDDGDEVVGCSAPAHNSGNGAQRTSFPLFSQSQNSAFTDAPLSPQRRKTRSDDDGMAAAAAAELNAGDITMDCAAHLDADVLADAGPSGRQQQHRGGATAGSQEGGSQERSDRSCKPENGTGEEDEGREEGDAQVVNATQSLLDELE